ncbi:MAG: OsmC family protein [FCB group bacterium]|jgi:putative redox protein|nr:OsmC family protein [FCB group bacterium]
MVRIDLEYLGDLRCRATHGPSGNTLLTDAPVDNHGKGEAFSPTDLVATALGGCLATVMGIVAAREEIDLNGMRIAVEKEMTTTSPRRIAKLSVRIDMPAIPEEQRVKLDRAAKHCPVHASLSPEVEVLIDIHYPVISA